MPEMDLGGGYGIAYTSQHTPLTPAQLGEQLADIVGREFAAVGDGDRSPCPASRSSRAGPSSGRATFTLYEVGTVKEVDLGDGHSRTYVSVDGGMSDNIRPALYEADYSCTLASRRSSAEPRLSRVVGRALRERGRHRPRRVAAGRRRPGRPHRRARHGCLLPEPVEPVQPHPAPAGRRRPRRGEPGHRAP